VSPKINPNTLDITNLFPFELDQFQKDAIAAINAHKSVVVSVPTGSGKTLVGEYAIHRAMSQNKRVFYTTPLKALSNQKLRDFQEQFGAENVGLLTGDMSVNRDAPILVMTTEIFRNMLYGTPIGQIGTSLEAVEAVVLDECHYMNDAQRGTVWEESIIYCPPNIQLIALSATIANAEELTDWINQIHGSTVLIKSNYRPIPLRFYFSNLKGLFPLLNEKGTGMNTKLKPPKSQSKGRRRMNRDDCPKIALVLNQLQEKQMLPAIYFIFSRRGCDRAVTELAPMNLVTPAESAELNRRIDEFLTANPSAGREGQVEPLRRGVAAHHAGILPAWKGFVEELFQAGLVKIIFATETLAAGINMPARTTVISTISKRIDVGHRLLTASEFLQMAGRAGRRGMDPVGYVVTVQTPFEGAKDAAKLALSEPNPLVSQFTPSYGMVLNLLQTHNIDQTHNLLEQSFSQYLAMLKLRPQQREITSLTTELAKLDIELAPINTSYFGQYQKLKERQKEERRLLKTLQKQALDSRVKAVSATLPGMPAGSVLYLKGKHIHVATPLPAILMSKMPSSGQGEYLVCLGSNNCWYVITSADVIGIGDAFVSEATQFDVPPELDERLSATWRGDESTAQLIQDLPPYADTIADAPEVIAQTKRLEAVTAQIESHPLHQFGKPGKLIKRHKRRLSLKEEIHQLQTDYRDNQSYHWQEFLNLVEVLREFSALENYTPTPLGETAAAIRGENELWLGLVLASGELDTLDPHHLAATVAALISEPPRSDSWTDYPPPPAVFEVVERLQPLRRHLIQRQHRYNIPLPVWLEQDLIELLGIVEQWVLGVTWEDLCENTSFDEGDLVRLLRRTLDLLSQIPHVPHISSELKRNAVRAIQLMERFPVQEVLA
jgi:superfamily II RNA helicase